MSGFITERDFDAAEEEFPGIRRLYESLRCKPRTFLELVWIYERVVGFGSDDEGPVAQLGAAAMM